MLTEDQKAKITYVKTFVISQINQLLLQSQRIKEHLSPEVAVPLIHLEFYSIHLEEKNLDTIENAVSFLGEVQAIITKISYAMDGVKRKEEALAANPIK